jgi:hypothetical protein
MKSHKATFKKIGDAYFMPSVVIGVPDNEAGEHKKKSTARYPWLMIWSKGLLECASKM